MDLETYNILLSYGLFSEYLPVNFNTTDLTDHLSALKDVNNEQFNLCTFPSRFSIHKTDLVRREIKIPNARKYFILAEYMKENWEEIKVHFSSEKSLSNPIINVGGTEFLDIPSWRDLKCISSNFKENKNKYIQESIGSCFSLKIDILNCYGSIYTHSIEWAVIGKEAAKKRVHSKSKDSNIGCDLDKLVMQMQSGETYGLPVGPFTSRIISEIVLAKIDRILVDDYGYRFRRFVDDYTFYFSSEQALHEAKSNIAKCLRKFNFSINASKVEVTRYPYDRDPIDIHKELKDLDYGNKQERFIKMIEKTGAFHAHGKKGAYKYVLKMLKSKTIPKTEWPTVQAHLLSIMMIEPKLAQYIAEIVLTNYELIKNKEEIGSVINTMLSGNLDVGNEHEVLWLLWLSLRLDLDCNNADLLKVLENGDDLSKIVALDIIQQKQIKDTKIATAISNLVQEMITSDIYGERWLLMYTMAANKFSDDPDLFQNIQKDPFYTKCLELGIRFYKR